jgi:hypothetical protein
VDRRFEVEVSRFHRVDVAMGHEAEVTSGLGHQCLLGPNRAEARNEGGDHCWNALDSRNKRHYADKTTITPAPY